MNRLPTFIFRVERALARRSWLARLFLDNIARRELWFDGQMRVLPGRTARLLRSWRLSPELTHESGLCLRAYEGGDMLDIGAFHGTYSLVLAPKARPGDSFISFEPDFRALPVLLHSLEDAARLFPQVRFGALPQPVGDGTSFVAMEFPDSSDGHPSFRSVDRPVQENTRRFKAIGVDAVVSALGLQPAFIKVDVEGAEYHVLDGMQRTLREFRPTIMLEIHPEWLPAGISVEAVYEFLRRSGYERHPIDERHQLWKHPNGPSVRAGSDSPTAP